MKVKLVIEAGTDAELLEAILAAYNAVHDDITDVARVKYASDAVLKKFRRGVRFTRFGSTPSYEIGAAEKP